MFTSVYVKCHHSIEGRVVWRVNQILRGQTLRGNYVLGRRGTMPTVLVKNCYTFPACHVTGLLKCHCIVIQLSLFFFFCKKQGAALLILFTILL